MSKKKPTSLQKAKTAHLNNVEKAIKVLENTMDRVKDATSRNIQVDLSFNPEETMRRLQKLKNSNLSLQEMRHKQAYLREAMQSTYYDKLVHYHLDYQQKEGSLTVNIPITISQYEINRLRRRELTEKGVTKKELGILLKWKDATQVAIATSNEAILSTPENVKEFLKQSSKKRLDLSIGGMSSLINDLSYSSGTSLGKEFVDWLRTLMQGNKEIFATLEKWYNTDKEGQKLKYTINNAIGKSWYTNYREFATAVIEFIEKMDEKFNIEVPDKLKWDAEKEASEALT